MAAGNKPCFRWPVTITAANNNLRFQKGASTYNITITAGTYYLEGDDSANDLIKAFRLAWAAGYLAAYGVAATFATQLSTSGMLSMQQTSGSKLELISTGTTFPVSYMSGMTMPISLVDAGGSRTDFTGVYQVACSWYPDDWPSMPLVQHRREPCVKHRDLMGRPHYKRHALVDEDYRERRVRFDAVAGARMLHDLAADADAAAFAGLTVSDPWAPFEAWATAIRSNTRALVYSTTDVAAADYEVSGPYYVDLPEEWVEGVPLDAMRQDLLAQQFAIELRFVE